MNVIEGLPCTGDLLENVASACGPDERFRAHLSLGWRRTVAHTIFVEGLAMRATQRLHPGQPDSSYTGKFSKGWLARCEGKRKSILADLGPNLSSSSPDAVMRFTMGQGGAGIERKAYYAGWLIVGNC